MELEVKDYEELDRLGINLQDALKVAPKCKTIRDIQYTLYFDAR